MLAALTTLGMSAFAEDSILKDVSISGSLDLYYQYSFNKPALGTNLFLRQFDVTHDQFSFADFIINFSKTPKTESPWGFTLSVAAGKNQDIENAVEPGGTETYKNIAQAYVSWLDKRSNVTLDLGKFNTWVGLESAAAPYNDFYSISFLYYVCQPIYHMGLRATRPINDKLTGGLYLVNGWNEVEDSNASKSYGASLSGTFGKTSVTANYYGGVEGSGGVNGFFVPGQTSVQIADLYATHQLTPMIKLAVNGDYGSADGVHSADPSGHFYGLSGYVKAQFTPKWAAGVRYEAVGDPDGLRTGFGAHLNSLTAVAEYALTPAAAFRLEFRKDTANQQVFESDNNPRANRSTITLSHVVKF